MLWRSEDVAIEVEALVATYGEELLQVDEATHTLRMPLLLPAAHEGDQHFVQCALQLTVGPGYPEQAPPAISLQDVRGFAGRQAALAQELAAAAAGEAGEMVLGLLFETARAWLTDHNCPEGPCIFCLECLEQQQDQQQHSLLRLPCFHAFHWPCFAGWWCWQQAALEQQQAALEAKTGATAAAALVQEALPPREGAHFQLACPSCRAAFSLQDLQQCTCKLLVQQLAAQDQGGQEQDAVAACARKLTALQLQPFRELQAHHAALFKRQQQRQGVIVKDVSYSISDWEGPQQQPSSAAGSPAAAAAAADDRSQGTGPRRSHGGHSRGGRAGGGGGRGRGGHQQQRGGSSHRQQQRR